MASEDTQNKIRLAPKITKNATIFKLIAKATIAAANPQYQDSALKPSDHLGARPADATVDHSVGKRRATAFL